MAQTQQVNPRKITNSNSIALPNRTIVSRPINPFETTHIFFKVTESIGKSSVKKTAAKILLPALFFSIAFNLIINTKVAELAFAVQNYQTAQAETAAQIDNIDTKLNAKLAPNNLLNLAKSFSMVAATDMKYIDIKKHKIYNSTTKNPVTTSTKKKSSKKH
jgi:hypothetical protein